MTSFLPSDFFEKAPRLSILWPTGSVESGMLRVGELVATSLVGPGLGGTTTVSGEMSNFGKSLVPSMPGYFSLKLQQATTVTRCIF